MPSQQNTTRNMQTHFALFRCICTFLLLLSLLAFVSCNTRSGVFAPEPEGVQAVYPNISFYFWTEEDSAVIKIRTGSLGPRRVVEPTCVELRDGQRFFFPDLPFDVVSGMADRTITVQSGVGAVEKCYDESVVSTRDNGYFYFLDGQLLEAKLRVEEGAIITAISLSEEGPYIPLNFDRKKMIEMFGEPDEWLPYHIARAP